MTSITITRKEAIVLAANALTTYERRIAGYPPSVGEDRIQEIITECRTGKVGKLALSEEQFRKNQNILKEENERIGLENARQRAEDLVVFFQNDTGPMGFVSITFDDWCFLAKAEDIKVQ